LTDTGQDNYYLLKNTSTGAGWKFQSASPYA
jgi:hypothetical protein